MTRPERRAMSRRRLLGALAAALPALAAHAFAAASAFQQGMAQAVMDDPTLSAFYRARGFEGIWAGSGGRSRGATRSSPPTWTPGISTRTTPPASATTGPGWKRA